MTRKVAVTHAVNNALATYYAESEFTTEDAPTFQCIYKDGTCDSFTDTARMHRILSLRDYDAITIELIPADRWIGTVIYDYAQTFAVK